MADLAPAPEHEALPQETDSPPAQPVSDSIPASAEEPVSAEAAPHGAGRDERGRGRGSPIRRGVAPGPPGGSAAPPTAAARAHAQARSAQARSENLDRTQPPAAADAVVPVAAGEAVAGAGEVADATGQDRRPRRHRRGRSDQDRPDQNRSDQNRPDQNRPSQARSDQNRGDRGGRPERHGGPDRAGRGDRPERDPELRAKYLKGRNDGRDRRDKAPDPNSPFAKLAALKEQLEANAKERR